MSKCTHNWNSQVSECPSCQISEIHAYLMRERNALRADKDALNANRVQLESDCELYNRNWKDSMEENAALRAALERIKDGGLPPGVLGDVTERMLVMCEIASGALQHVKQDKITGRKGCAHCRCSCTDCGGCGEGKE